MTREELAELKKIRHSIEEEKTIELVTRLLEETSNPRLVLPLEAVLEDEKLHHVLLAALVR